MYSVLHPYSPFMVCIYLLTPWIRVLLQKLNDSQIIKKPPSNFMEIECSLPHSHVPTTWPSSDPDPSSPYLPHLTFLKIYLNIILPFTHGSSKCSLSLRFSHQTRVVHNVLVRKPEGNRQLGRPRRRWETILRWIFRKWEGIVGTRGSWIRIGTGVGRLWVR